MDRTPQLPPSGSLKPTGSPAGAFLEFRAVSFAYPSRSMSWVLKDFCLQVKRRLQQHTLDGPAGQTILSLISCVCVPLLHSASLQKQQ